MGNSMESLGCFFIVFLVVVLTGIWVYRDARQLQQRFGKPVGGQGAGEWCTFTILLWIVGFPDYLITRARWLAKQKESSLFAAPPTGLSAAYCQKCGNPRSAGSALCASCGTPVEDDHGWWVRIGEESHWASETATLHSWVSEGRVGRNDLVWDAGMSRWIRSTDVQELQSQFYPLGALSGKWRYDLFLTAWPILVLLIGVFGLMAMNVVGLIIAAGAALVLGLRWRRRAAVARLRKSAAPAFPSGSRSPPPSARPSGDAGASSNAVPPRPSLSTRRSPLRSLGIAVGVLIAGVAAIGGVALVLAHFNVTGRAVSEWDPPGRGQHLGRKLREAREAREREAAAKSREAAKEDKKANAEKVIRTGTISDCVERRGKTFVVVKGSPSFEVLYRSGDGVDYGSLSATSPCQLIGQTLVLTAYMCDEELPCLSKISSSATFETTGAAAPR